jgi:hypothetical protein
VIKCEKCKESFDPSENPGGLAFSPPMDSDWLVKKIHLCSKCWTEFLKWCKDGAADE